MESSALKVLLLEDNQGDLRLLQEMLKEVDVQDFEIVHTERLSEAIGYFEDEGADVILTDLGLPDSKGIDTFLTLREHFPYAPIVVLTSESNMEVGIKAVKEGAQDFLVKGLLSGNMLVRALRYAFERQQTREELRRLNKEVKRRARDQVYLEKERLAVTLGSIADAVIATDTNGSIILINRVAEELTHWSEEDALGKALPEVFQTIHLKSREACEYSFNSVVTTRGTFELSDDAMLLARDGDEYLVSGSASPIFDRGGDVIGVVIVFRDVTEMKKWEDERARLETIESLGLLAGGIAHDFNNILTGVLGNVNLAKVIASPGDPVYTRLEEAEKALDKAGRLVKQLMTVSKGGEVRKETVSVAQIVTESASLALSGSSVTFDFKTPEDLWPVVVDTTQIGQVVQNLVLNAAQAMPDGGDLKIEAENLVLEAPVELPLSPGKYIQLTFRDHGVGIAPQYLKKVFDPYFTTKHTGSGLGLAVVYSAVSKHDGYVSVESKLGRGTTFHVFLPASEGQAVTRSGAEVAVERGAGRVLVMDDEPLIRDVCSRMLEHMGYQVEAVDSGDAAVERYFEAKDGGEAFDAVVLDLTIPGGIGGREVLDIMRERDPEVKAIASSGYSRVPVAEDCTSQGFAATLGKPYTIDNLGRVMKAVIMN